MASVQNEQRIATCQSPRKRATSPRSESAEPAHHRSKRVKTEDQHREEISQEVQFADMPRDDLPSDIASERHEDDIATFAAQAEAAIASAKLALGIHDTEGSDNNVNELSNGTTHNATELPASPPDQSSNFEVDFSSAPSDPVDLALWVAKQISKFGNHPEDSAGIAYRQNSITHPPALQHRRFDEDDDPEIVAERERVREEARERKKRWRESNSERNKDNDLRCRINKRAKQIWGEKRPAERLAWIENEFNKRRAKREYRERYRSFDEGFKGFGFPPGFGQSLFPAPGVGPHGDDNAAGVLLANVLMGAGNEEQGTNSSAAHALKAAIERGTLDPESFREALRAMAANPDILNSINAALSVPSAYGDGEANSADEDESGMFPPTRGPTGENGNNTVETEVAGEENEIIKALNAATAMLNQMNEARQDGKGPDDIESEVNGCVEPEMGGGKSKESSTDDDRGEKLVYENGQNNTQTASAQEGSSQEREHDIEEPGQPEKDEDSTGHINETEQDTDISVTLQHVLQQVMGEKRPEPGTSSATHCNAQPSASNQHNKTYSRSRSFISSNDPAQALSSLLHCAGMSINTVIPAAQSYATSQLYARLSGQSRSTSFSIGINPAHASAYGNTAAMNRRLLAQPHTFMRLIPTEANHSTAAPVDVSRKKRSAEEEKMARSYGFPPLPGMRLGLPRRK